jgi:hypothetical protein
MAEARWWRSLQAAWRLSWGERWLLLQAWVSLPPIGVALRVFGLRRLWAALGVGDRGRAGAGPDGAQALGRARDTARLVQHAARFSPFRATCLTRSLVLWWLLGRQGIPSDLRIGVAKEATRFQAHAWVEYRGVVLNDGDDVGHRFSAFDGLPRATEMHRSPGEWLV